MPFSTPLNRYRPTTVHDGEGGLVVAMGDIAVIFTDPMIQNNQTVLQVAADEDIRIGDLIEIPHNLFL